MPDQTYMALHQQWTTTEWLHRVRACILHTAVNVKIKAAPTQAEGPADALGRSVVANPEVWAERFAPVVAVILIGQPDLSEVEVTDAELFSAVDAAWPKFYAQPALV